MRKDGVGQRRRRVPRGLAAIACALPIVVGSKTVPAGGPPADCPSIVEFGAVPGDGRDDSAAIQEALLDPRACTSVPAGVFDVGTPLRIELVGSVVRGQGAASVLRFDNSIDVRASHPSRTGILNILSDDVTVERISIDQNFRGSGRRDGARPVVASLAIGAGEGGSYQNITIRGCVFLDYYGDAVQSRAVRVRNVRVMDNVFRSAFIVGGWKAAGRGGEQAVSFDLGSGVSVTDNRIEGALDDAIAFHRNVSNVIVARNTITTTGGRILLNGTSSAVVTGNGITYIQDGATAIFVSREPVPRETRRRLAVTSRDVLIADNTITVQEGVAVPGGLIYLYGGESIRVSRNSLRRAETTGYGIRVADRELGGARYGNTDLMIAGNLIAGSATGIAVHVTDTVANHDIFIARNIISGCTRGIVDDLGAPYVGQAGNNASCASGR